MLEINTHTKIEAKQGNKLKSIAAFFWTSYPSVKGNKIYAIDYAKRMHIFDIKRREWEITKSTILEEVES